MAIFRTRYLSYLGLILITGCVLKEPYPSQWPDLNAVKGTCPDISGIYTDKGFRDPFDLTADDERQQISLSRLLFSDQKSVEKISHLEIIQEENHDIKIVIWSTDLQFSKQTFHMERGSYTCESGFIELVGERVCEAGNGVMACATPETHMIKNSAGDLIIKTNSRGFGAVYLVPVYVSEWHWYHFKAVPEVNISE